MEWTTMVVARLIESKREGIGFEEAWERALVWHPPRGRDCGPVTPSLLDADTSLVGFFKVACSDAWHGRKPALRHLVHVSDLIDGGGEARHGRSTSQPVSLMA